MIMTYDVVALVRVSGSMCRIVQARSISIPAEAEVEEEVLSPYRAAGNSVLSCGIVVSLLSGALFV